MKKKKKLIHRIGALLCALVVVVSSVGVSGVYYGASDGSLLYGSLFYDAREDMVCDNVVVTFPSAIDNYEYYILVSNGNYQYLYLSDAPFELVCTYYAYSSTCDRAMLSLKEKEAGTFVRYDSSNCVDWSLKTEWKSFMFAEYMDYNNSISDTLGVNEYFVSCNHDIALFGTNYVFFNKNGVFGGDSYNADLGYLQNVSRKSTYLRDALYNYDDDSLTYHWYHDLQSTSGIDLTSGEYKIRHFISNATVKGYEKEDIVEMSEKYLMAEYDASQGYFSYLQKDYLEKIEELGYVEPSWIDIYLKGYFTLQHHYFQIVNTSTNEIGGYLHFYPKDATGESFGVEMEYEGLDDNFEVDEDGPSGYIDTSTGSGETLEDALENADQPKLDDLGGIDPLIDSLEGYATQIGGVTSGIGALLGSLPPWVLGLLGLSVGMLFVVIVVKAIKG